MADAKQPRAVSGEIMTDPLDAAAGRTPLAATSPGDVIDAEYITLVLGASSSAPPRAEPDLRDTAPSIVSPAPP